MPQSTRRWISRKVDELRHTPQLPFHDLLEPDTMAQVLEQNHVTFRDRIFTPLITLWTFLSQILSPDHSCREAVARLIAFRVARGRSKKEAQQSAVGREAWIKSRAITNLQIGSFTLPHCVKDKAKERAMHVACRATDGLPGLPANSPPHSAASVWLRLIAPGISRRSAAKSSSVRTSIRAGVLAVPIRRISLSDEMIVGAGMVAPSQRSYGTRFLGMSPRGEIAKSPCPE